MGFLIAYLVLIPIVALTGIAWLVVAIKSDPWQFDAGEVAVTLGIIFLAAVVWPVSVPFTILFFLIVHFIDRVRDEYSAKLRDKFR